MEEKTERRPGKVRGLVGALVAAATLLGGVVAFFQLRDIFWPKPSPPKVEHPTDGWRRVQAGKASLEIPPGWKTVDRDVFVSAVPDMEAIFSQFSEDGGQSVAFFLGPDPGSEKASQVAFLINTARPMSGTLDQFVDDMRRHPQCRMAKLAETHSGPAARGVLEREIVAPDGLIDRIVLDSYSIPRPSSMWVFMVGLDGRDHLDRSEDIERMAQSLRLPE